jgi:hypothetical protein
MANGNPSAESRYTLKTIGMCLTAIEGMAHPLRVVIRREGSREVTFEGEEEKTLLWRSLFSSLCEVKKLENFLHCLANIIREEAALPPMAPSKISRENWEDLIELHYEMQASLESEPDL